jgi:L-iditol 2-dehydrogenase
MTGSYPVQGALAEEILYPANKEFLIRLPDSLTDVEGAMLEPLGVAMHALELHRLRLGDMVAVLGCGPIGLLIIRLARLAGASDIVVTDPLDYRLEAAERMGATLTINPDKTDPVAAVTEATHGRGVDVVYDACAAAPAYYQGVEMAKRGGVFVLVGMPMEEDVSLPYTEAWHRELTVKFQKRMNDIYPRALKLVQQGVIDLSQIVSHRFSFEDTIQAYEMAHNYEDGVIKAVVYVNDPSQMG